MRASGGSEAGTVGVADDLRVLAGLRTRTAVRDRHLGHLFDLLADDDRSDLDRRYLSLQGVIDVGIDAMHDPDHQRAARALLGFGPGRWRTLAQRGGEAASAFGLGWDGYRRKRESTGVSLLEETLAELATSLSSTSVEEEPTTRRGETAPRPDGDAAATVSVVIAPATEIDPLPPAAAPARPARRWIVAAAAIAAAALATAWGVRTLDPPPPDRAAIADRRATCGNLQSSAGALAPSAGTSLQRWQRPFRRAAAALPAAMVGCAAPIEIADGQIFERISGVTSGVGALLAAPSGGTDHVVVLNALEWTTLQKHRFDATDPSDRLGNPIRRTDRAGGLRVVEFTGGAMVQEATDAPSYAVVQRNWEVWRGLGGLDGRPGRPLSEAHDVELVGRVQDFADGRIITDFGTGTPHWEPATAADRHLPDGYRGAVVVAASADAWFVDLDGRRHWLPTATDFECARSGHDAEPLTKVAPIAIAALPLAEPFRCR